jgi:hypothetical protein
MQKSGLSFSARLLVTQFFVVMLKLGRVTGYCALKKISPSFRPFITKKMAVFLLILTQFN